MQSALRPYVTTGVALAGATMIAAASVLPVEAAVSAQARTISSMDVGLVASSTALKPGQSYANIIPNLFNAVLSIPRAEIDGINRFSAAMEQSASWWVYSDVNVLGWDPPNQEMTKGFVDMLLPFKPFSEQAGIATFLWFAANFPMDAGCSGLPPCPRPDSILSHMFQVAPWEFYTGNGYTFPEVINPVSENETHWGQELGETGDPAPWSETHWLLDPNAGWNATWDYLLSNPEPLDFPSGKEIWDTTVRLTSALWKSWYPFVPQSTLWNPQMSLSAYILRPFAPILCPSCNKADPFMPLDWAPGDDIPKGSYVPLRYKKNYDADGHWIGPVPGAETTESNRTALLAANTESTDTDDTEDSEQASDSTKPAAKDFLAQAVQNLTKKFSAATAGEQAESDEPANEQPAVEPTVETPGTGVTAEQPAAQPTDDTVTVEKNGTASENPGADESPQAGGGSQTKTSGDGTRTTKKWTFGGKHRKAGTESADASSSNKGPESKSSDKRSPASPQTTSSSAGATGGSDSSDSGASK
ncbi:hypothetical protein EV589_3852 [Mycobacterium sp. BK558]|nr:hypothetical protein EV589_3852 [Mycobacterium sp. BK558]